MKLIEKMARARHDYHFSVPWDEGSIVVRKSEIKGILSSLHA